MFRRNKKREVPGRSINIWSRQGYFICGLGEKNKLWARFKHSISCLRWSWQRIVRGYADSDVWDMDYYLQKLIPDMLQYLKDNHSGSPAFLGKNYTNEDGVWVNDTCHAEWDSILDRMIFLWREANEVTCSKENPYKKAYEKADLEFEKRYGVLGEKLQTEKEREEHRKLGGGRTAHFMGELPEYKEIYERYREKERELDQYRSKCKDEALDMLKEYFYALWD